MSDTVFWRNIIAREHLSSPLMARGAQPTEAGFALARLLRRFCPFVHRSRLVSARAEYLALRDEILRMAKEANRP